MKRPIPHCYWVSPGQFLVGEYPRDLDEQSSLAKLNALMQAGVSVFIDLTEKKDGLLPYEEMIVEARYLRFPIRDVSVPETSELMLKILDAIDLHINESKVVYVHCWGGIGRTGTVVGCWLARHGHEGQAAYDRLQELWRHNPKSAYRSSPETLAQKQLYPGLEGVMISLEQRYQGCLMGLAVGDAVGTTVEFKPPGTFSPVEDMVGGGPFALNPGEWTDDTSMALCLADSLLTCKASPPRSTICRPSTDWKAFGPEGTACTSG